MSTPTPDPQCATFFSWTPTPRSQPPGPSHKAATATCDMSCTYLLFIASQKSAPALDSVGVTRILSSASLAIYVLVCYMTRLITYFVFLWLINQSINHPLFNVSITNLHIVSGKKIPFSASRLKLPLALV